MSRRDDKTRSVDGLPMLPPERLAAGTRLEHYQIERFIAGGGQGDVYLATHVALRSRVAIKVLRLEYSRDERFTKRLLREARAAAGLNHEGVVKAHHFGQVAGRFYFAMDYVEGEALSDAIRHEAPLDPARALLIAEQVAEVLAKAHDANLVHRDIKPANILLDRSGPRERARVTDFGLTRKVVASEDSLLSMEGSGTVTGTPAYMAPEQAGSAATSLSDQYSLGVTLFEMVTGKLPYDRPNPTAMILAHVNDPFPDPLNVKPDLSQDLSRVILRMTQKNPAARFASMREVAGALQALRKGRRPAGLHDAETVSLPSSPVAREDHEEPPDKRPRWIVGLKNLILILILAALAIGILRRLLTPRPPPPPPPPPAPPVFRVTLDGSDAVNVILNNVPVGEPLTKEFVLGNEGEADLRVTEVSGLTDPFEIEPTNTRGAHDDWVIAPGKKRTFRVTVTPQEAGPFADVLTFYSNDPDSPRYPIKLAGSAAVPVSPDDDDVPMLYEFDPVEVGRSDSIESMMSNPHTANMVITRATPVDPPFGLTASAFDGTGDKPAIKPGDHRPFTVTFSPIEPGRYTAEFTIYYYYEDMPTRQRYFRVELKGTGISASASPSALPMVADGEIVFASDTGGDFEIYRAKRDGTDPIQLTDNEANDTEPRWSPTGKEIAFLSDRSGPWQLFTMPVDGERAEGVQATPVDGAEPLGPSGATFDWSPDGKRLVFIDHAGQGLWTARTDGADTRRVVSTPLASGHRFIGSVSWRWRENTIVFSAGRNENSWKRGLFRCDVRSDKPVFIEGSEADKIGSDMPALSPNGREIVARRRTHKSSQGRYYLYLYDGVSGGVKKKVPGEQRPYCTPRWSGNGDAITFSVLLPGGDQTYRITRKDGWASPQLIANVRAADVFTKMRPVSLFPAGR